MPGPVAVCGDPASSQGSRSSPQICSECDVKECEQLLGCHGEWRWLKNGCVCFAEDFIVEGSNFVLAVIMAKNIVTE